MLRVLHGPVNVGNQPWVLSRHERALGAQSDLVVNYNTWLAYSADHVLTPAGRGSLLDRAKRLAFGMSAPLRYDVLHLYFGLSFLAWNDYGVRRNLWFKDLHFAKRLGRRVFMTLQGCDVRLSDVSAQRNRYTACSLGECSSAATCRSVLDRQRRWLIDEVIPLVDRVFVLNPDLATFVPGASFAPYASVDIDSLQPDWPKIDGPITILHAPSDPSIKGTRYITAAVERLKKRYPIEFVLVKGLPHAEALKLYQRADLLIDQTLVGWYGGLAVELMAMGKPVACYLREEDFGSLPAEMAQTLPMIRITIDSLESDLEQAITDRRRLAELGRQSRNFVERWHHPRRIAAAMLRCYEDPKTEFRV
jgi:glycosyltransferase involved in cell wall biosynthesis